MLALFENGLVTDVGAGENRGRRLRGDFVVRRLRDLGALPPGGAAFRRQVEEVRDPDWDPGRLGAAVFLQDPVTRAVYDAASVYPLPQAR